MAGPGGDRHGNRPNVRDTGLRDTNLRDLRSGDLGWATMAQSELYAQEYGWDTGYEALVLRILADFADRQGAREHGWVAEQAGQRVGVVFVMEKSPEVAQLRLLHVDKAARGSGTGGLLVDACLQFSREAGYRRIELWTQTILSAAVALYASRGFELISEEPHQSFGVDLVGQYWGRDV